MRVQFSRAARRDLREIAHFIRQDNPPRALSFVRELRDRCNGLASAPLRYPIVPGREGSTTRRAIHGAYGIYYSVLADEVRIARILHSARDHGRILFPEDD